MAETDEPFEAKVAIDESNFEGIVGKTLNVNSNTQRHLCNKKHKSVRKVVVSKASKINCTVSSPSKKIKFDKNSSQSPKIGPRLSHKKPKNVVKEVKKVKSDKNECQKSDKTVKTIVDYFMKKSGASYSDNPKSNTVHNANEIDVQNVTVRGKVSEMKNAFEIMMLKGGDTQEKTPRKRLKRLENASTKKEKTRAREN